MRATLTPALSKIAVDAESSPSLEARQLEDAAGCPQGVRSSSSPRRMTVPVRAKRIAALMTPLLKHDYHLSGPHFEMIRRRRSRARRTRYRADAMMRLMMMMARTISRGFKRRRCTRRVMHDTGRSICLEYLSRSRSHQKARHSTAIYLLLTMRAFLAMHEMSRPRAAVCSFIIRRWGYGVCGIDDDERWR